MLQSREQCDNGVQNGQSGSVCSSTCQITQIPSCGDAVIQVGEECDDGNTRDGDGCTTLCKTEQIYCPDGKTCGKGKCSNGTACIQAFCGDAKVQSALNEECDDGNKINNDDCSNSCHWVPLAECGDGILQSEFELCDAGGENSNEPNAECRLNCVPERCGDGIIDSFIEECDDGNNINGDGCSSVCTLPEGAAPIFAGTVVPPTIPPTYYPPNIPTPARTPTGPGLVIFLASGAAAGVGVVRRRYLNRK